MLGTLGWIIVGILIGATFTTFWDEIRNWLNNTAADAVEKVLGYNARTNMQKAVATIDKIYSKVRNRTIIYTKKNKYNAYLDKVTIEASIPESEIEDDVIAEIKKEGKLVGELKYNG